MAKHWTHSFGEAVADIRHKVLEEGWFGKAVTPRAQTITIGTEGEQSPAEKLGWFQRREHGERTVEPDVHERTKDAATQDRGIDL